MWAALGATLGALSLTRENALVLVALVLVWAVSLGRHKGSQAPAALVVVGLAIVLAPVVGRNYLVGGGVYLTTSQFGSNLFIGNNAQADGSYVALRAGRGSPEFERIDAKALAEEASGRALTAGEVSRYWTRQTLAYVTSQPGDWLRLLAHKARLLVSATELVDTESQDSHAAYSWPLRILGRVWHFGVALPLAVVGAWALWGGRRRLWIVYAMVLAYAATVVVFFVVARYRLPLVPMVLFFSAAGVIAIVDLVSRREPRAMLAPLTAAALAALVANWPVTLQGSAEAITENNLGTALQEDGRLDEAIDRYRRALAFDARYVPALNNLGTALRAAGRLEEAVATYGQALEAGTDAASIHYNLGNALMAKGDAAGAAAEFQKALAVNPRFVEAMNNLGQALDAAGAHAQAIATLRRAIELDANSAVAHRNLANALASAGASAEAASHFREAIRLAPDDAALRYDYGSLLLEQGAFQAAASELAEAVRVNPGSAEAHNNLGIALASQGQVPDAISHWREAIRLKPDFADARRNLDRAGKGR
jgi:tetratricopeptide (TPR) repeat protein